METNINKIISAKGKHKLSMITTYSFFQAKMAEEAGMDILLVGDSLGNVMLGYENTLPVSMDEMSLAVKATRRGAKNAFIVADMPFLSYQTSISDAIYNAGQLIKDGANAVKIEGSKEVKTIIRTLVDFGIPVMGHIGLTPQQINRIGTYKVQGKTEKSKTRLLEEADIIENSGAFSLVLELVVEEVAKQITDRVNIPTIGIGAGRYCDGQVLVWHDLLGINTEFTPKFVKRYGNLRDIIVKCLKEYISDVNEGRFPTDENVFKGE
ncbi:MAG: 3-methyl-2-oxobutanoate hydroxymethyltransferase [Kosmotoga sp.]|nr:MAG: 3-methyl-2-oxobutanoate hydroxymethyltransferase [Kosmotoga sp.]